jgi:predicted nucleic acid-binding protein
MIKQKVYLETTMFNYYFDETKEDRPITIAFFKAIEEGQFEGFTSAYTVNELENAAEPKRTNMLNLIKKYNIVVLKTSDEADHLAATYIKNNIIPEKKNIDAQHIAIATVNDINMILSYNFKHINKIKTKSLVPVVNQLEGYRSIIITQPKEVIDYEMQQ